MDGHDVAAAALICYGLCIAGQCFCQEFCKWCGRSFASAHPFRPGCVLPRRRGRGKECDCCSAVLNLYYKGEEKAELNKDIKKNKDGKKTEFMDRLEQWEQDHRDGGEPQEAGTEGRAGRCAHSEDEWDRRYETLGLHLGGFGMGGA